MSDQQKGLVPVLMYRLPNTERKMCTRHIWSNWHVRWRGEERRKLFWRCAKASFEVKFREEMQAMPRLGKKEITEDMLINPPTSWCRAYFKTHSKCDIAENNMCETFNSWILAARHKSIITMLEDIRHQLMNRYVDMIKFAETWISDIAPMARTILEANKEYSNRCRVLWNGVNGFEIEDKGYTFFVHLDKKYCDCRLWMLRGIPCPHAICAYYYLKVDPDQHVEHWYNKETFLKSYSHFIQPITNMRIWTETKNPSIESPKPKKMPGRPGKNRRKKKDEPKKWGKLSRKGVKITCSRCKQVGHNKTVRAKINGMRISNSSQPSCHSEASWNPPPPQSSSICGDTSAMARHTYTQSQITRLSSTFDTYATTQSS
ncbi:uncharacterized protein LOC107857383 [Capsicum annuum]|uniref:uncharacterized protein LOC107857383 n=1 Tax=Capsicum annuum TaxID=4072 RepID=UPI001FB05215|nr:uncharacterized protein LOC107857383 [Capsicum annuum]XP_047257500.1 uncharacterized protein LOC107857383 [Capsicum annuum]